MTQPNPKIRLFVPDRFSPAAQIELSAQQSHYLSNVMRSREGESVLLFNGEDGEWLAEITRQDKKRTLVVLKSQQKEQEASPDLWLAFAPIKGKSELVVEKATELGVSKLIPVITRHSVVRSVNMEKLQAHATEAAEQCERLDVPHIETATDLPKLLGNWPKGRILLYGDESGSGVSLRHLLNASAQPTYGILIGPEGGFAHDEHKLLSAQPFVTAFSMGPRILRADTASVAALACVQAWLGDWEKQPHFKAGA